jgi:hypothetical protein
MLAEAETQSHHAIGAFIQEVAHGARIRHWLALDETARWADIHRFVHHASVQKQTEMAYSLLQVAAAYPDCAVRRELIGVYGVFQVMVVGQGGQVLSPRTAFSPTP